MSCYGTGASSVNLTLPPGFINSNGGSNLDCCYFNFTSGVTNPSQTNPQINPACFEEPLVYYCEDIDACNYGASEICEYGYQYCERIGVSYSANCACANVSILVIGDLTLEFDSAPPTPCGIRSVGYTSTPQGGGRLTVTIQRIDNGTNPSCDDGPSNGGASIFSPRSCRDDPISPIVLNGYGSISYTAATCPFPRYHSCEPLYYPCVGTTTTTTSTTPLPCP